MQIRLVGSILLFGCFRQLTALNKSLKFSTKKSSIPAMNGSQQDSVSYIDSSLAKKIDDLLMLQPGFTIDQLMELAGYSVACCVHSYYHTYISRSDANYAPKVLLYCGPGNNGGDGLVAARHLKHFGFSPFVIYPRKAKGAIFDNLAQQIADLEIPVLGNSADLNASAYDSFDVVVDALFGFSFMGPSREPFTSVISSFASSSVPVISVDIPSGWDVNDGDKYGTGFVPAAVISLTAPKLCMKQFQGVHYIGGRYTL